MQKIANLLMGAIIIIAGATAFIPHDAAASVAFSSKRLNNLAWSATATTMPFTMPNIQNALIVVDVPLNRGTEVITSVTWNSEPLTMIGRAIDVAGGADSFMWAAPTASVNGTFDVVVNKSGSVFSAYTEITAYSGVKQTYPFWSATSTIDAAVSTNFTQSLTSGATTDWMLVMNTNQVGDPTAGTNNTERVNGTGTGVYGGDSGADVGVVGNFDMTTNGSARTWAGVAMMISAAPAAIINSLPMSGAFWWI